MASRGTCGQIASFFFFLLSYLAFVAAFSSNYWMDEQGTNWGLWKVCTNSRCTNVAGNDIMTAPFIGAQALMVVALVCSTVSLGAYIGWIATQNPRPCVVAWATNVSSGFCMALGLICWGNESVRYYGLNVLAWSFWLALASCVLTVFNSGVTACVTGCGANVEEFRSAGYYSSRTGHPGGNLYGHDGPHNTSEQEYSDITNSEYSMGNMNPLSRPGPPLPKGHPGVARY